MLVSELWLPSGMEHHRDHVADPVLTEQRLTKLPRQIGIYRGNQAEKLTKNIFLLIFVSWMWFESPTFA